MYVPVCKFPGKTNSFDFFGPSLPKNGFRIGNSIVGITINYQEKTIVGIRISIIDISFGPIFSQNKQL